MPGMRHALLCLVLTLVGVGAGQTVYAQDPPPKIGPFVVDLRGVAPTFGDNAQLALSRGLSQAEMPGLGLGVTAGAHVYLPKVLGIVLGLGGEAIIARSGSEPPGPITNPTTGVTTVSTLRPVTETFRSISPQISLNFGSGNGWSYLSLGMGRSQWSIGPEGAIPLPVDEEVFSTFNYGGGARWFMKKHLAFTFDVRFYEIDNSTPVPGLPGSPHTLLLIIGAGISVR